MKEVTIGNCRLICGDAMQVLREIKGTADLVVTDPPYKLTAGGRNGHAMSGKFASDRYDNSGKLMSIITWAEMAPVIFEACKEQAEAYVMANNREIFKAHDAFTSAGWREHNLLTWEKPSPTRNKWYMKNLEFTLYLFRGKAKTIRYPGSKQSLALPRPDVSWHPTAKPVELFEHYIRNSSDPGDLVVDPFGGSGTCAIAAMKSDRRCLSIEINEEWFEKKVERVRRAHAEMQMAPSH